VWRAPTNKFLENKKLQKKENSKIKNISDNRPPTQAPLLGSNNIFNEICTTEFDPLTPSLVQTLLSTTLHRLL